jgi:hypothetical protein
VVVDQKTRGKLAVVGMVARLEHGTGLGSELIEVGGLDSIRDLGANLLGYKIGVDMVEARCEALDSLEDLVEAYRLTRPTASCDIQMIRHDA